MHKTGRFVDEESARAVNLIKTIDCYMRSAGQTDVLEQAYERANQEGNLKSWDGKVSYRTIFDASKCEGDSQASMTTWNIEASQPNGFCTECSTTRTNFEWHIDGNLDGGGEPSRCISSKM